MARGAIPNPFNGRTEVLRCTLTITIPEGTTAQASTTEIDYSSCVPSGKTVVGMMPLLIGNYALPYYEGNYAMTLVRSNLFSTHKVTILNRTSAWPNYAFSFLLFVR